MSYAISFSDWRGEAFPYDNLTFDALVSSDDTLRNTYEFREWISWSEDKDYDDIVEKEDGEDEILDLLEAFRMSDEYYNMQDTYTPIMNYLHVLQCEPTEEEVLLAAELVGNVSILYVHEFEAYFLGLTGGGMDLSDNLELAYYIVDGVSPVIASQVMSLSKKAEALLMYCRDMVEKHKRVAPIDIKEFIEKYDRGQDEL